MTDYTELVKALTCGNDGKLPCHNNECPYWVDQWHGIGLCNVIKKDADAASAIEALQAQLPKQGDIVRCRECRYRITAHGISDGWVLCSKPYTERGNAMHRADWFCADGEREVQE